MVSDAQKWFLGVQTWFLSHLTWFLALRNGFWVCRHGFWRANMKNVCWISGWGYSWGMKTTKFSLDRGVLLMLGLGAAAIGLVWVLFLRGPGPQTAVSPPPTLAANGRTLYRLDPAASEARFTLDEVLRGQPTTVVGRTADVAGEIAVNLSDLSSAEIGPLQINARTLATDSPLRNTSIASYILYTDDYPVITFTPTAVSGLPPQAAIGQTVAFSVTGDLALVGMARPVTFAVTVTAVSDTRLAGHAQANIQRADFELAIPRVDNVADVSEAVLLELDFTAVRE